MIDFKKAWDHQENLFKKILESKRNGTEPGSWLLLCEHPHVYTLGKSGSAGNLLINSLKLHEVNASFYRINRGGDITYHGPGQIVGYPILDLEKFGLSIKSYIFKIEESIIKTLDKFNIPAGRLEGATGVWLSPDDPRISRKICAIGVRASRYVTMHGFAFNINTNLKYFEYINPCGFTDKGVTSLEKETGKKQNIRSVKKILLEEISDTFEMYLQKHPSS